MVIVIVQFRRNIITVGRIIGKYTYMHIYKQTCIETAGSWKMLIQIEKGYLRIRVFISLIS